MEDFTRVLSSYVGREIVEHDVITASPADRMAAWLDRDVPPFATGDPLPPGWHCLYFLEPIKSADLGQEGGTPHRRLLPPLPLTRELWGGSRIEFLAPLRIGDHLRRVHSLIGFKVKSGRSGPFLLITLREEFYVGDALRLRAEIDLLLREDNKRPEPLPAPQERPLHPYWSRTVDVTPPYLFLFSALTYNSHRIHYDRPYTETVEGYPRLLVHGPLQAILMLDLARRHVTAPVRHLSYRALRPMFEGQVLMVEAAPDGQDNSFHIWTCDADGALGLMGSLRCG